MFRSKEMKIGLLCLLFGIVVLLLGPDAKARGEPKSREEKGTSRDGVLVIGKVSSNPKKHYRYLKPIANYAASRMKDLGITQAGVLMARDNAQMIKYLKQGKVDWVTETIFSAILYMQYADAEVLVKKWKKGVPEYHTVFFTRKESRINNLSDLSGKKIAFEDPGSTTAFFYPASAIIKNGMDMVKLSSPMDAAPKKGVGYVFSNEEINISTWVYRKMVDAGAFNNLDWEKDDHIRASFRQELRIFHQMPPLPRAMEVVRKELNPAIKNRLKTILLTADEDPKAKHPLWAYQKTEKFETITASDRQLIKEIKDLLKLVQNEIE